jgi:hypothetical protein
MFQINHAQKSHSLDTYSFVLTKFNEIKSIDSFTNFSQIHGQDLITISNISFDCLDKLADVSGFIERKLNDSNLNETVLGQLNKLDNLNNLLHEQIYLFNNISHDITIVIKDITVQSHCQEVINYINFDLITKYKQIIFKIFNIIKKINIYVELLKPKLN